MDIFIKQEIAENFINGNLSAVTKALFYPYSLTSIGRAFEVYQYIRGQYGAIEALKFSNWLQKFADD